MKEKKRLLKLRNVLIAISAMMILGCTIPFILACSKPILPPIKAAIFFPKKIYL